MPTPPPRTKPMVSRTIEFLREHIRSQSLQPGSELPPIRALSVLARVSKATMCSALLDLKSSGEVALGPSRTYCVTTRSSIRRTPKPADPRPLPVTLRPWRRAVEAIKTDIINGALRPGSALPSMKELERRYGISFKTIKKALARLSSEGMLALLPNGSLAIPSFETTAWKSRIVCIVQSIDTQTMAFGQNDEAVFQALFAQCEQSRIDLDVHLFVGDALGGPHRVRRIRTNKMMDIDDMSALSDTSVLGFVYLIPWTPCEDDDLLLRALLVTRKPIAVLDETGEVALRSDPANRRLARFFTVGRSSSASRDVARHLVQLRHRNVAFISADHAKPWSQQRLEGLVSAYAEAGIANGVIPFVQDTAWNLYEDGARRVNFSALLKSYEKWRSAVPAPLLPDFEPALHSYREEVCGRAEMRFSLLPLLEKARASKEITAWVLANDYQASMALQFLKEKAVRIPGDLSLVSFDDSILALRNSISSYNFNAQGTANAMLGFILDRKPFSGAGAAVSGYIANHGTVGAARK